MRQTDKGTGATLPFHSCSGMLVELLQYLLLSRTLNVKLMTQFSLLPVVTFSGWKLSKTPLLNFMTAFLYA